MTSPEPTARPTDPPAGPQRNPAPAGVPPSGRAAPPDVERERASWWRHPLVGLLGTGLALPFALYYGLRAAGTDPWVALVLGGLAPLARVLVAAARARRLDRLGIFTLCVLVLNTAVGLITADARLLMALGGWVTALLGTWLLVSLFGDRPVLFDATVALMPREAAARWERDWQRNPVFRRIFRAMTAAWGTAFLLGAAARVLMSYTLPVDVVPLASAGVLLALLTVVVQASKAYGRRRLPGPAGADGGPMR